MYTILVCDDEKDIVSALNIYLSAEGYRVLTAYDGYQALRLLDREEVHLILLDVMMPGMDGITAMTRLRQSHNLPVILLTAKSEDTDKVLGLNMGADDYVTKPFNPVELLARVRSQLRRYMTLGGGHTAPSAVTIGGVSLDDNAKTVTVDGDTSTNDMCVVLANGMAGNEEITAEGEDYDNFCKALHEITTFLAKKMAGDGEGATALFETKVIHAASKEDARTLAKCVICSSLTKAAIFGHDANWGRILCALGYSGAKFDPENVDLYFESKSDSKWHSENLEFLFKYGKHYFYK